MGATPPSKRVTPPTSGPHHAFTSALPVNADYWRKGYVTYPNQADKTKSLESRAGHAIHLIGWDDNLQVQSTWIDGAADAVF